MKKALKEILTLPKEDRILIVEAIWESIANEKDDMEWSEEIKTELDRREALQKAGKMKSSPWTEVKKRLRAK